MTGWAAVVGGGVLVDSPQTCAENMRRIYIWEDDGWPEFAWDRGALSHVLAAARKAQGLALGAIRGISSGDRGDLEADTVTADIVSTSAIEGVLLNAASVHSSVMRRLGLGNAPGARDRRTEGLTQMALDATTNFLAALTPERLFRWHTAIFEADPARPRMVGAWRDDAEGEMQILSGAYDDPRIHYQAPPASRVASEMQRFCEWFNMQVRPDEDGIIRSGIAHLRFLSVHPFEDGNGRIARTLADLLLARDENSARRFISMARQINATKGAYYATLEATQSGSGDVSVWLHWYLEAYREASAFTLKAVDAMLRVKQFWDAPARVAVSDRQRAMLKRYLGGDFEGFLSAKKYAKLAKVSVDTAARDLADLLTKDIIFKNPGAGKNTSYDVALAHRLEMRDR